MPHRSMGQLGFDGGYGDPGPLSEVYVWRDRDGSLVGGSGGYAVANNPSLLPTQSSCRLVSERAGREGGTGGERA